MAGRLTMNASWHGPCHKEKDEAPPGWVRKSL